MAHFAALLARRSGACCAFGLTTTRAARALSSTGTPGKVKVRVKDASGHVQESLYACGTTLMAAIRDDPVSMADMQGSCDGKLECSTCHIYCDSEAWAAKLKAISPVSEKEEDVLDRVLSVQENSRLACQIVLSPEMDGLEVAMPQAARDVRFQQFVDRSLQGKK